MVTCHSCNQELVPDDFRNGDAAAHETSQGVKVFCNSCWSEAEGVTPGLDDGRLAEAAEWFRVAGAAGSAAFVTAATAAVAAGIGTSLVAGHLLDIARVASDRVGSSSFGSVSVRLTSTASAWLSECGEKLRERFGGVAAAEH
jgi:hypothetical protein